MDTLVLNADLSAFSLLPLSIINYREAIKLIYLGKVQALEEYEHWIVHSQKMSMHVPAIVVTKKYFNKTNSVRFTKGNVALRDDYRCQYCGDKFILDELTLDHYIPKSMGGKKSFENCVISCGPCNWSRGHDISIKPMSVPRKPTYFELVKKRKQYPIFLKHKSWNKYLQWPERLLLDRPTSQLTIFDSSLIQKN